MLRIKFEVMVTVYYSEDGHEFKIDDFVTYAVWKIQDLKNQGYLDEDILNFDDCAMWKQFTKKMNNKFTQDGKE